MSEELIEYVASQTGPSRRQFITRLLAGAAFAAPVVATFAIGRGSSAAPTTVTAAAGNLLDCGPNSADLGGNTGWFDFATNQACNYVPPTTSASTTTTTTIDTGANTGESGGLIPGTK